MNTQKGTIVQNELRGTEMEQASFKDLINDYGMWKTDLLNEINSYVTNPKFSIAFCIEDVITTITENVKDLFMPTYLITTKKPNSKKASKQLIKKIKEEINVFKVEETKSQILFECHCSEGTYANSIGEIFLGIRDDIGPFILRDLEKIAINDYKVTILINSITKM